MKTDSIRNQGDTASDSVTDCYIICTYSFPPIHQTSHTVTLPSRLIKWDVFTPEEHGRCASVLHNDSHSRVYHTDNTRFGVFQAQGELRVKHCLLLGDSLPSKSLLFSPETWWSLKYTLRTSKPYSSPDDTPLSSDPLTAFKRMD